tara:strand:+ start:1079 stop:1621 length:543 start_codon:yes stop_codon:yes gene_type:complete
MAQDLTFITTTIQTMTESVQNTETLHKIIGTANQYAKTMKFSNDKTQWSDEQLDKYLAMIEKLVDMPVEYTQDDFDKLSLEEKLDAAGLSATDITPGLQGAGDMLGGIVEDVQKQNKYRDDLKCPYCKAMVYDNRNSKKSDKSPDFTCSTNDPVVCGGHTGKWRKSWWLDNTDIPAEWNV